MSHLHLRLHEYAFRDISCILQMQTAMSDCAGQKWTLVQCYAEDYTITSRVVVEMGEAIEMPIR